jgi:hypothetical protein
MERLSYPESVILPLGIVLLICTILYIIPHMAVFGAILLTGYLGRRCDNPTHPLCAVTIEGNYARRPRLRRMKDTPWASLFNAQHAMVSQWIEGATSLARKVWRIEEEAVGRAEKVITQFSRGEA